MKDVVRFLGIVFLVATIGFSIVACGDGGGGEDPVLTQEMLQIPAGSFVRDGHTITLSAFRMSNFQVTQELYEAVMGNNPSFFQGTDADKVVAAGEIQGKRPVEMVSWYDAIVFCNRLSILEDLTPAYSIDGSTDPDVWISAAGGDIPTIRNATWDAVTIVEGSTGYRLPTEAQWEFACRAGSNPTWTWHFGNDEAQLENYAWYEANSNGRTRQVGLKQPNAWGLYDKHGNLSEWVWDWWGNTFPNPADLSDPRGPSNGDERVLRGASWLFSAYSLHSATRDSIRPSHRSRNLGFRVVCP